jgi:hypothetical protein
MMREERMLSTNLFQLPLVVKKRIVIRMTEEIMPVG